MHRIRNSALRVRIAWAEWKGDGLKDDEKWGTDEEWKDEDGSRREVRSLGSEERSGRAKEGKRKGRKRSGRERDKWEEYEGRGVEW